MSISYTSVADVIFESAFYHKANKAVVVLFSGTESE